MKDIDVLSRSSSESSNGVSPRYPQRRRLSKTRDEIGGAVPPTPRRTHSKLVVRRPSKLQRASAGGGDGVSTTAMDMSQRLETTKATRVAPAPVARMAYADGSTYCGQWLNGSQHGFGLCAFPSGNVYLGEWRNGSIAGRGAMLYADGSLFDGNWAAGSCDGDGTFYPCNGEPFRAVWNAGVRVEVKGPVPVPRNELRLLMINMARFVAQNPLNDMNDAGMTAEGELPVVGAQGNEPFAAAATSTKSSLLQRQDDDSANKRISRSVLFAVAGPSYTAEFSSRRFLRYFASILFPLFSIPHVPFCPLQTNILDLEREYVVSGAALRVDFEAPVGEVYVSLATECFAVVAVVTGSRSTPIAPGTVISLSDVVIPFVVLLLYALLNGAFHGHRRVAHALERLDRYQFPRLAKFSSSCVDGVSHVCVATWDDDGENVVHTAHYPRRWTQIAIVIGLLVAGCGPTVRGVAGLAPWGSDADEIVSATASFLALWIGTAGFMYYFCKITDMQRQVYSRMYVLSCCAYLRGQSVLRPTDHREISFALDADIDYADFTRGFIGWYTTRCFALYASTCSNHVSRMAAMSMVSLALVCTYMAVIADGVYAAVLSDGFHRFTTAHLIGFVLLLTLGNLHLGYLYVCLQTEQERVKHVYLADVAVAFHLAVGTPAGKANAAAIAHCRDIIREHDVHCTVLSITVSGGFIWLFVILHLVGLLVLCIFFAEWIHAASVG